MEKKGAKKNTVGAEKKEMCKKKAKKTWRKRMKWKKKARKKNTAGAGKKKRCVKKTQKNVEKNDEAEKKRDV